jgi:hypothetical protein
MANIQINQLPTAGAITGQELVPIQQNGVTVQTTTAAISASPSQNQPFLTVSQQPTLPNSRYFSATNGLQMVDGGAQNPFTVSIVTNPTIPGTAGMAIPSGTTAQRNTTPAAIRFNSQTVAFEGFDGTNWVSFITNVAPPLITFSAGTTGLTPNTPTGGNIVLAGTLGVANGGTGLTSVTANRIPYGNGTSALQTSANLTFNGTTLTNTGNAIIADNSANAALRITQTGAGNALLVEDSANPDSTPFVIDTNGRVITGNLSSVGDVGTLGATFNRIQVVSTGLVGQSITRWDATANAPYFVFGKSRSGTVGAYSIVSSGDSLGIIEFAGDDGTDLVTTAASITAAVDGTPGVNDMPGRLVFSTTADGASTPTERMRIASTGLVTLAAGSGLSIARTAVTAPAATDGNLFSGTYTPTLTNTTNIDASTASVCQYMRVGNVVTVSGRVEIDPTAAGRIALGMSLPIASNLGAATQAGGTFASVNTTTVNVGSISGDSTNDRAFFDGVVAVTVNTIFHFSFTYLVV